ncbi:MAG: hypothetical protein IPF92_09160 [Myxococcales bacterium]|jgi:hypothetical protein|nr:hypothetical protein [Myxococcales bacterium]MBL0193095.1 hypothetical protein [Myxococcales bacterium]HQY60002.1 hypothetical protein [Polyangiaceae bacterium]
MILRPSSTLVSFPLVALATALVAVAACSSTPTPAADAGVAATDAATIDAAASDATPPPPPDGGPVDASKPDTAVPGACDTNGFVSVADDGFVKSSDGSVGVVSQTTLASPVDAMELVLVPLTGNAVTVGKRTLTAVDASYDTCKTCVLIRTKCDDNLSNCQKTFMAKTGSVDVTTFGGKGGRLEASLDVSLVEVTIDGQNKTSPVAGGKTWCLAAHKVVVAKLQ